MIGEEINEIIQKPFESVLTNNQIIGFKKIMKGSDFVLDYVDELFFLRYKARISCGGWYSNRLYI